MLLSAQEITPAGNGTVDGAQFSFRHLADGLIDKSALRLHPQFGELLPFWREMQSIRAPIPGNILADHHSGINEPVYKTGDIAFCYIEPFSQISLGNPLTFRECGQQIKLRNGKSDSAQPLAHGLMAALMQAQETEPDTMG